jgi:hypothetical protein
MAARNLACQIQSRRTWEMPTADAHLLRAVPSAGGPQPEEGRVAPGQEQIPVILVLIVDVCQGRSFKNAANRSAY